MWQATWWSETNRVQDPTAIDLVLESHRASRQELLDTRAPWLAERLTRGGFALALAYAPLHALSVWFGLATVPSAGEGPSLWLTSGLLGAVVCSSAPNAWRWLLPTATAAEFAIRALLGPGVVPAHQNLAADALLALTTTAEAFIGGGVFRIWMEQRRPPPTETVILGLFVVVAAGLVGATARFAIARFWLLDDGASIRNIWAAPLLGAVVIAPLVLALGFNVRGHAGSSDGSRRELLLALLVTFSVGGYVFSSVTSPGNISINYMLFPPLIWLAARFRPRVTFAACVALCVEVTFLHAWGFGPFAAAAGAALPDTMGMQIFMIMLVATALLVTMARHEFRLLQMRQLDYARRLHAAEDAGRLAAGIMLHDGVGQSLTALALTIRSLVSSPRLDHALAARLDRCARLVGEAHAATRSLLAELHPPGLADLGLTAALESLVGRVEARGGLHVAFSTSGSCDLPSMARRQLLYRCARELLANVVGHAGVDRAELSLREHAGGIELEVLDHGVGWDATMWQSSYASGMAGLFGLKDQVELHGGQIDVASSPGRGCCVRVRLPTVDA